MAYNLLVLGPMQHRAGDTVIRQSNTMRIGKLLDQMSQALTMGGLKPFRVVTPESPNEPAIVELVMGEIEQADSWCSTSPEACLASPTRPASSTRLAFHIFS